jgi:hypothetical protein
LPRLPFEWHGPVMMVSFGQLNIELRNHHTRLVANGSFTRLQKCKLKFYDAVRHLGIKEILNARANVQCVYHEASKIKKFAWKSLHGILPCYGILANRHVPISGQCPRCSIHCEDIKHVLFECEHAIEV